MNQPALLRTWLLGVCCLLPLPAAATDLDLMGQNVEGVRLGMSLSEAATVLENHDYKRTHKRTFEKRTADGMHYVGLKVNPGSEVVSVEVAHFLNKAIDPDAKRDTWIKQWGEPDRRLGNPGHDWRLYYENNDAVMQTTASLAALPSQPNEVRIRLVAKHQVLASRRGHEVSNKICMAIKDKPVSMLTVHDRDALLECLRTGQLRIVAP